MRTKWLAIAPLALALAFSNCGYHTAGKGSQLPPTVKTIAVPSFVNQTQTYHVETRLTEAVVREFNTRTRYKIVSKEENGDAVLRGTVTSAQTVPVTYDSRTGQVSTSLVTVAMKVTLTSRDGRVLYDNPNYIFREQYQIARETASFFEEQGPALDRLSRDFARTLVSNILEAF
ncbi:MAG TPA: LptE family protein [candidate division Zixibacteria bacterium]|nr:LptE family protein [candidate division Zixibacteria bacterium]